MSKNNSSMMLCIVKTVTLNNLQKDLYDDCDKNETI
jgi:hypothetical protein